MRSRKEVAKKVVTYRFLVLVGIGLRQGDAEVAEDVVVLQLVAAKQLEEAGEHEHVHHGHRAAHVCGEVRRDMSLSGLKVKRSADDELIFDDICARRRARKKAKKSEDAQLSPLPGGI